MAADEVVHVAEAAQLLLDPNAGHVILLVVLLARLGLLARLQLLHVGGMVASCGLRGDRGAADHPRVVPCADLVRSVSLSHLLWVHHRSRSIASTSGHDALEVLHLPSADAARLAVGAVDDLRRVHDSIRSNALELLLHVLLLRRAERSVILRPHVHCLAIRLTTVHRVCWVRRHGLIGLLFSPCTGLSRILHLLHRPVLRLPLGL